MGRNPRFIVTNLEREADEVHDRVYCQRADMENRIEEQPLALFADRTSSSKWWTSQYRLLLAGMAYTCSRRCAARPCGGRAWSGRNASAFVCGCFASVRW